MPYPRTSILLLSASLLLAAPSHRELHAQTVGSIRQLRNQLDELAHARDANASRLTSAIAIGRVTRIVQEADAPAVTTLDADIQIAYDAPRFRVHLVNDIRLTEAPKPEGVPPADYQKWISEEIAEQVILFDGDKLTSVVMHADESCTGTIYFGFAKMAVMRAAGYPFENPVMLWEQALKVETLDLAHTEITPLAAGGVLGTLTKNTYRMKFFVLDDFDYDLRRVSSYRIGESQPFRDYVLNWQQAGDIYYVSRFSNTVTSANGDTSSASQDSRKLIVQFRDFQANLAIDEAVFDLASIQVPEGTVFTDKRSSVAGGPKQLVVRDQALQPLHVPQDSPPQD